MSDKKYEELKLFNDSPFSNIQHDALNFDAYAEVIYESILGTQTPCTIGIFGEWGMGKTSMMNMAKKNIDDEHAHISVWFNAWQYENEEHTIVPLIATIIKELKKRKDEIENSISTYESSQQKESIEKKLKEKSWLDRVHNALRSVASGVSVELSGDVPLLGEGKIAFNGKDMVSRYDELMKDAILEKSLYFDAYEKMEELSCEETQEKIVIFIDDLDRCLPDKAVKLLENIKLFLSQKGFVFVLGIAREVVEGYLQKRYDEEFGVSSTHGNKYLDKIVQIPIVIPTHSQSIDNLSAKMFEKIGDGLDENLQQILSTILKQSDGNPRTLTRLINRIKINSRISEKIKKDESKIEEKERIYYFAIACSLQELFPDIYYELINRVSIRIQCIDEKDTENKIEHEELKKHLNKENSVLKEFFLLHHVQTWLKNDDIRNETVNFIKYNDSSIIDKDDEDYWKKQNEKSKDKLNMNHLKKFVNIDGKYEFSKYLVTNSWYDEFIKDGGYKEEKYWQSKEAKEYLKSKREINSYKDLYEDNENDFLALNQPIVNVSFYEAEAFCVWLSNKDENFNYALPTNEEFKYVATKGKEIKYPWGDSWDENKCNNLNLNIRNTSCVGLFSPDGDSSFGISDMSGNVWKWTSSKQEDKYIFVEGSSWANKRDDLFSSSKYYSVMSSSKHDDLGFFLTRTKK